MVVGSNHNLLGLLVCFLIGINEISGNSHEVCFQPSFNSSIPTLAYDEAYLLIDGQMDVTFYAVSTNCYNCSLQRCGETNRTTGQFSTKISSRFPFKYAATRALANANTITTICKGTYHFGEHGHYRLQITTGNKCKITQEKDPIFTYLPLIVMFAVLLFACIVYIAGHHFYRKYELRKYGNYAPIGDDDQASDKTSSGEQKSLEGSSQYGSIPPHSNSKNYIGGISLNSRSSPRVRLKSLDTFRGISIMVMIFVNYQGGGYWFFNHSKWNGLTVADLVFPWFIFIMGASIFISCRSMRRKSISKVSISKKIVIRTIKLFAIGLFINQGADYDNWRIPGVLQRFAGSYFVVAMLNVWLSPEEDKIDIHYNYDWRDTIRDLTWFPFQHVAMLLLLIIYLCLTFLLPVPSCPTGFLGPAGISVESKYENCTGGAAAYIDRKIFGINHIYRHPTCTNPYNCSAHDPEGLLGVIPSILLTYFGLMASRILFMYSRPVSHIKRWLLWAVILGCLGIGLCEGKRDGGLIPINKNLWSLSFIFATASMSFLLLTICYVLVDIKRIWSGAPFSFAGMNAILLYCGHEILSEYFPFNFKNNDQHSELLTRSAVGTFVWGLVAYLCYRTGTFLKL